MAKKKYAGRVSRKVIEWVRRANQVFSLEEARKLDEEFTDALKRGEFWGWKTHFSAVSDLHPNWRTLEDRKFPTVYVESPISGVRISYFFDEEGKMIGRSYFDKGDISPEEVRNQIAYWEGDIIRGRPREGIQLPISDHEIYRLITTRDEWCKFDDNAGSTRKARIKEAIERIIEDYKLVDVDDPKYEDFIDAIELAYKRERRRARKKP
jgi:hypothetical protein